MLTMRLIGFGGELEGLRFALDLEIVLEWVGTGLIRGTLGVVGFSGVFL